MTAHVKPGEWIPVNGVRPDFPDDSMIIASTLYFAHAPRWTFRLGSREYEELRRPSEISWQHVEAYRRARAPEPKCTCTGHYGDLCLLHQFAKPAERWLPCTQPPTRPGVNYPARWIDRPSLPGKRWIKLQHGVVYFTVEGGAWVRASFPHRLEYLASGEDHAARERGNQAVPAQQPVFCAPSSGSLPNTSGPVPAAAPNYSEITAKLCGRAVRKFGSRENG